MTGRALPSLHVGVARLELTVPDGVELSGFASRSRPHQGIHDPLQVAGLYLHDGVAGALIITADVLGFEAGFVAQARLAVQAQTGVPAAHIMLTATHTHNAPASMFLRHCGKLDAGWMAHLLLKIVQVSLMAISDAAPAQLRAGRTSVPGVSVNRRAGGGALDDRLDMLRFGREGKPPVVFFCFGAHPISLNGGHLVSADFPGVLRSEFEVRSGAIALYANGASADINPVFDHAGAGKDRYAAADSIGNALAETAANAWDQLEPVDSPELKITSRQLDLPYLAPMSAQALAEVCASANHRQLEAIVNSEGPKFRVATNATEWAFEIAEAVHERRVPTHIQVELQVMELGRVALVALPGEIFATLGLAIKNEPSRLALVLGTSNGNIGYIPAPDAYQIPGYEVGEAHKYYGHPAALAPEAGAMIVSTARELLNS